MTIRDHGSLEEMMGRAPEFDSGHIGYSSHSPQASDSRSYVEWASSKNVDIFVDWLKKQKVSYKREGDTFYFPQFDDSSIRNLFLSRRRAMSNLRSDTIRLAHSKPELREHLLPLLKEAVKGIGLSPHQKEERRKEEERLKSKEQENRTAAEEIAWRPAKNEDEAEWQEMMDSKAKKDRLTDADRKKIESRGGKIQKKASTKKPLYGHTDANSAYVVDDYPYGFKLRTQAKFWLEHNSGKGYRFVMQTMDPRNGRWNKPKASTYTKFAGAMYLDEKGHVQWTGLGEYSEAAQMSEFLTDFPGADTTVLKHFVPMKVKLYEKLLEANAKGSSGFTINGVVQPATEADVGRNRKSLEEWTDVMKKL